MNKDRAEGKIKDVAGRVERQVGEWTGDTEAQVKGAAKQVEGKVQNAWGKAKDAVKESTEHPRREHGENVADDRENDQEESATPRRRTA
jgi:uncharacterized protein YjbJ (UPF0337 family)